MQDWKSTVLVMTVGLAFVAAVGCGAAMSESSGPRVLHSQCSSCHPTPEAGAFGRAEVEKILGRHKGRVNFSGTERTEVIDYLSSQSSAKGTTGSSTH